MAKPFQMSQNQFSELLYNSLMMNKDKNPVTEKILNLTLEIICLLTGEDCIIVKKRSEQVIDSSSPSKSGGLCKTQSPIIDHTNNSSKHDENKEKVIIHAEAAEVPVRCEDVAVYLSMEEWEYLEEHKEHYKDVMMENQQPLSSQDAEYAVRENICFTHTDEGTDPVRESLLNETLQNSETPLEINATSHEESNLTDSQIQHTEPEYSLTLNNEHIKVEAKEKRIQKNYKYREYGRNVLNEFHFMSLQRKHSDDMSNSYEIPGCSTNNSNISTHDGHVEHDAINRNSICQCSKCGKTFTKASSLVAHWRIHTGEKPFVCSECGKSFTQASNLSAHRRTHTGVKPFVCAQCGNSFTKASSLVAHQRIHTGEKPFACPECGKTFSRRSSLLAHQIIHTKKPFSCLDCGKYFADKSSFLQHQMLHTAETPFECRECGKRFLYRSYLNKHQEIHTGRKQFVCSKCGKCFSQCSNLIRHQKIHAEKVFPCLVCGRAFSLHKNLLIHQRIHVEEKPFSSSDS